MQSILIIDDAKENIVVLSRLLKQQANVVFATGGEEGLRIAASEKPDLILLDIAMPGLNGFQVMEQLKKSPSTAEIPIIIITGIPDSDTEELGLNLGAVDYITKPFASAVVKARVRHQLKLQRLTSELKKANARLTLLAMTDPLTGAHNRRHFLQIMENELARSRRYNHPTSLLVMDIDRFKSINDNYGHDVGDRVIVRVVEISTAMLRKNDVFGRMGGEEFTILLPETPLDEATLIANRLCAQIAEGSVRTTERTVTFTVSCGVTQVQESDSNTDQILKRADIALYQAKTEGRNRVITYDPNQLASESLDSRTTATARL
ncbi:MAG: GGDEF domain-containing response regulator [Gammaproteobacteria bacterium]